MPTTLTMPKLSPTMEEGTITAWQKAEGDYVEAGDVLFEVSTDKATVEYTALDSGWLKKILVPNNKTAIVNEPVAIFTENKDESIEGYVPPDLSAKREMPEANKEPQETGTPKDEDFTPKATYKKAIFQPEPPLENYKFNFAGNEEDKTLSSPLARKIAKDRGLDIASVKGSGPNGRIVKADLDKALVSSPLSFGRSKNPKEIPGSFNEVSLNPVQKVIAERLQESKSFIPHFYVKQIVQIDKLIDLREQLSTLGLKCSINDCMIKACAFALREHPSVNSGFNSVNNSVILFKTIDIAVAVTLDEGLITPIIRHADFKNLGEISAEVRSLAARAKAQELNPEEYKGGSFTISNMGMFGISGFSAIINPPQAAILAIGGIQDQPIVKHGHIVPAKTIELHLSADHRVINGVAAAKFLKTLQHYLEAPASLLLTSV